MEHDVNVPHRLRSEASRSFDPPVLKKVRVEKVQTLRGQIAKACAAYRREDVRV
jgi:hypothetical protein